MDCPDTIAGGDISGSALYLMPDVGGSGSRGRLGGYTRSSRPQGVGNGRGGPSPGPTGIVLKARQRSQFSSHQASRSSYAQQWSNPRGSRWNRWLDESFLELRCARE